MMNKSCLYECYIDSVFLLEKIDFVGMVISCCLTDFHLYSANGKKIFG